ncbi:hypothetical protein BBJ28_00021963 [Nothophytophthora sp. Chile5]|nr:hypothetical protein BBJ28_00021963 [Nothophytophthora sp. Chile5]
MTAAAANDLSRTLKGIGDAVSAVPGKLGYVGVAFSLAASVAGLFGGGGGQEDPVLTALNTFQDDFHSDMAEIQTELDNVNANLESVIVGIDEILSDISQVPTKVVAEMQMTAISVMKDKFANVQRSAANYAAGNLTRDQMISKCDDFDVASLFSELETILKDEKDLFGAKFGGQDHVNGKVQAQLLHFYISVIPLVTNCNALKYSTQSIDDDGDRMQSVIQTVLKRAAWYLAGPDRVIHVREAFNPFGTEIDVDGYQETKGYQLALSFKAFSFAPPHASCFQVISGAHLTPVDLDPMTNVPDSDTFCAKAIATDDASNRVAYAERKDSNVSILQPELEGEFDPLGDRGWEANAIAFYSPKVGNWRQLPQLKLVADFQVLQAESSHISLDELTESCQALGDGYDRDGDGHSKDYKGAPWSIFCLRYVTHSIREIDANAGTFLADMQLNDMDAGDAWDATCPLAGYVRDAKKMTMPSKIKHSWLGGSSTQKAYAVCLKWAPLLAENSPDDFVERVWIDDSATMPDKPKDERNEGANPMTLPRAPSSADLANF